jgi:hypothetical protein
MQKSTVPQIEINQDQVKDLIQFIDASQSEAVKNSLFSRLGYGCFHIRKTDTWIEKYRGDVQSFLDWVNIQHASTFWEALEYTEDRKTLILTGRKVQGCACAFADCAQPPLSLCRYCCKNFQQEFFSTLLGQKVEVEITEAYLLGGERCSTAIHLVSE